MIELLDSQSMHDIMSRWGYAVNHKAGNNYFYQCPFHNDHDPSFCITVLPKDGKAGDFYCHGCKVKGHGAIELQARLMQLDRRDPKAFVKVCTSLAKMFNLCDPVDPERQANDNWRRARKADVPSPAIQYAYKPWDDFSLRALGCKVRQAFAPKTFTDDKGEPVKGHQAVIGQDGQPVKIYSWAGNGYYQSTCRSCDFDPDIITDIFGIRPVEYFITEERPDRKTGELVSWKVSSSMDYPIFDMHYETKYGFISKKYEPYARPDKDGRAFRFTWWFSDGRSHEDDSSLRQALYGDREFMQAFGSGTVQQSSSATLPDAGVSPYLAKPNVEVVVNPEDAKPRMRTKFRRLIICSGPRDGMNVYFHSDAHVCWPHSEATTLSEATVNRLRNIAAELYVLFDSDHTGIRSAEDLALANLGVKVIYLPNDLASLTSGRTGRPCKDASEYFAEYPVVLRQNRTFRNKTINDHFESLIVKAHSMKFWDEQYTMRKAENGVDKYVKIKYTLNPTNMAQFLGASGMYRYTDTAGVRQYVFVTNDGVSVLPKADINLTAKQLMKNYLCEHPRWYREDLMNMISTSARLSADTIEEIPSVDLDFRAYGEDFDFMYFGNCALKVTPDGWTTVPYSQMPFAVNVDAKKPYAWRPTDDRFFRIVINKEYHAKLTEHEQTLRSCHSDQQRTDENIRFAEWERVHRLVLEYVRPFEEWPPVMKYIYNTGRVYWRVEDMGKLTPEQRQFQDAQFIAKVLAFGYFIHRYRSEAMQRMVMATDYAVLRNEKPNGRNGKSAQYQLLSFVRNILYVDGKLFKKKAETASLNFYDYKLSVHDSIFIDDMHKNTDEEIVYNMILRMEFRTLYENPTKLQPEDSPKILVTCNKSFDVNTPSTYGRIVPIYFCDYYHAEDVTGGVRTRSMATEFHHDIFKPRSQRECQYILEFLASCLMYHLQLVNNRFENFPNSFDSFPVVAPVDQSGREGMNYGKFEFRHFIEWGNAFFDPETNAHHFARPVAVDEMILSLIRYEGNMKLTVQNVKQSRIKFMKDVANYCYIYGLVTNPDIVLGGQNDRNRGLTRKTAWVTAANEFDEYVTDYTRSPRTKISVDCMYFYTRGTKSRFPTPTAVKDVLRAPEVDLLDSV